MKAFTQREDFELARLTDRAGKASSNARGTRLQKANIRVKTAITLDPEACTMAQTSSIIDNDDKSAKEL